MKFNKFFKIAVESKYAPGVVLVASLLANSTYGIMLPEHKSEVKAEPKLTLEQKIAQHNKEMKLFEAEDKQRLVKESEDNKLFAQMEQDEVQLWAEDAQNHVFFSNKKDYKLNEGFKDWSAETMAEREQEKVAIAEFNNKILKMREKYLDTTSVAENKIVPK